MQGLDERENVWRPRYQIQELLPNISALASSELDSSKLISASGMEKEKGDVRAGIETRAIVVEMVDD